MVFAYLLENLRVMQVSSQPLMANGFYEMTFLFVDRNMDHVTAFYFLMLVNKSGLQSLVFMQEKRY